MEPVKSFRKVRCVSIKGDQVRFIPEHLADEICLTYKMVKQDSGEVEQMLSNVIANQKPLDVLGDIVPDINNIVAAKAKYEELTGKKAGNKKLETILKEIEEVTNKQ
jgi:hypothetical protein